MSDASNLESSAEPIRLLDDPELDPGLRHDLELARDHAPVAYSVEAGLARFEEAVNGASTVPAGGSIAGLRVLGWFVGAVALVGGGAWLLSRASEPASQDTVTQARGAGVASPKPADHADDPDGRARARLNTLRTEEDPVAGARSSDASEGPSGPRASESVAEAGVRSGAGDAGAAPMHAEGGSPAHDAPAPPRPASKPNTPDEHDAPEPDGFSLAPSLADEAALINAARKALASDPAEALALMREAERSFPKGAMIQERRGYTILALVGLGELEDAEARADAYLERWPNGPLSRRVRAALGR